MTWITGNCLDVLPEFDTQSFSLAICDPPYSDLELINVAIPEIRRVAQTSFVFMYAEDLVGLDHKPDQVLFWVKPISTKNTTKRYSRFVEVICVYDLRTLNQKTHWSTRSGVFTDALTYAPEHPFQKPESLIEKLIAVTAPTNLSKEIPMPEIEILDPFAGSGTVGRVCERLNLRCTSIEIDPAWTALI